MSERFLTRLEEAVQGLSPGYFALVMGSGIISVGLHLQGHATLSELLFLVCALSYGILGVLTVWRLIRFPSAIAEDFADPARAFGFFTFIAGTNVLGTRFAGDGHYNVTAALLMLATLAWLVLGYVIPWTAVLGRSARPVVPRPTERGSSG